MFTVCLSTARSVCICQASLFLAFLSPVMRADNPANKSKSVKPQWQRLLQGDDAKKAAELEKKLAQLQEAGQFAEALKVAEALTELRTKVQPASQRLTPAIKSRLPYCRTELM
jgi:hypothetical protein